MKTQTELTEQCLCGAIGLCDSRKELHDYAFRLGRAFGWMTQAVKKGLEQIVGSDSFTKQRRRQDLGYFHGQNRKEIALMYEQTLRYADDLSRIFDEEKAKSAELKKTNEKLTAEIARRKRAQEELCKVVSELTIAQQALRHRADHDSLTGLLNRSAVIKRLNIELSRSKRENRPLAVVMADLDHFKQVNDTHGHAIGDAVLREVAHRIRSCTRPYDLASRYGGEEILLVLPGCDGAGAMSFAERLRLTISNQEVQTDQGPIRVTLSLGVTWIKGQDQDECDPHSAIRDADDALYTAKESGRNCTIVAERSPSGVNKKPAKQKLVA